MQNKTPIISYIAIVFSFLALVSVHSHFLTFNMTDAGFIVNVLSILVTVLIGWNIRKIKKASPGRMPYNVGRLRRPWTH